MYGGDIWFTRQVAAAVTWEREYGNPRITGDKRREETKIPGSDHQTTRGGENLVKFTHLQCTQGTF